MGDRLKPEDIDDVVDAFVKTNSFGTGPERPYAFVTQATLLDWHRALNRPDTQASLQKNGKITSQQALKMFDEYVLKDRTREGSEEIVVEIVKAIKAAPQYAPQIKGAAHLSERHGVSIYFP